MVVNIQWRCDAGTTGTHWTILRTCAKSEDVTRSVLLSSMTSEHAICLGRHRLLWSNPCAGAVGEKIRCSPLTFISSLSIYYRLNLLDFLVINASRAIIQSPGQGEKRSPFLRFENPRRKRPNPSATSHRALRSSKSFSLSRLYSETHPTLSACTSPGHSVLTTGNVIDRTWIGDTRQLDDHPVQGGSFLSLACNKVFDRCNTRFFDGTA
jgi:hypothetical protein